jgi:hypothetical protein
MVEWGAKLKSDPIEFSPHARTLAMNAAPAIEQEFLPLRAKLLEVAAALDRLDRVGGADARDPRMAKIHEAIELLLESNGDRAEQAQLVFSRRYDDDWRENFGLPS